jgi:hypothetical protein
MMGHHRCSETADETARVPGELPPGHGRGGPQHGDAIRHALRLPIASASAAVHVEYPPERSRRRSRRGGSGQEPPQHVNRGVRPQKSLDFAAARADYASSD